MQSSTRRWAAMSSSPRTAWIRRPRQKGSCSLYACLGGARILGSRIDLRCRGLPLAEILMDECDRHAAFTDARSDALDRAVANVADRENARHAGLQQIRIALERPRAVLLRHKVGHVASGANVTALVANYRRRQPRCRGVGSDEHEKRIGRLAPALAAAAVLDDDRFQMVAALDADDLTQHFDLHVGFAFELSDQVVRHCVNQRGAAYQNGHDARIV